jgi:hypothetical protein
MATPVRKKNADGTDKSDVWWLRKKVPHRYRALVGSGEIWRSLGTTDRKAAGILCVKLSAEFDRDWEHRLQAARAVGRTTSLTAPRLTVTELSGLQRLAHEQTRDDQIEKTLKKTIEMYPRYDVAALRLPPAPRRRSRRTREQIRAVRGRPPDRSEAIG